MLRVDFTGVRSSAMYSPGSGTAVLLLAEARGYSVPRNSVKGSRTLASLAVLLAFGGRSVIPDSGPNWRNVESNASVRISETTPVFNYALIDLNKNVLPFIIDPGPGSLYRTFGTGRGPVPEIKVGTGDTVQVTLFEAQSGGLFIPTDAGARPGNYVTLPAQTVDSKGYISVPYAGQILALN